MVGDLRSKRREDGVVITFNLPIRLGVIGSRVEVLEVQEFAHVLEILRREASAVARNDFLSLIHI